MKIKNKLTKNNIVIQKNNCDSENKYRFPIKL
jgi:hypothetical protein